MAVSRALRRLLRIRDLQEEQSKLALESALSELHRLEHALVATFERNRRGRSLVQSSAQTGQLMDRLAGLEETRSASLHAAALGPRIDAMGDVVVDRRQEFLAKRVERRQAETLIEETEAREATEAGRRGQQALDDWYSSRLYRDVCKEENDDEPAVSTEQVFATQANVASHPAAGKEKCA
jgi:flagellar biosynthesis chaperone FliJ